MNGYLVITTCSGEINPPWLEHQESCQDWSNYWVYGYQNKLITWCCPDFLSASHPKPEMGDILYFAATGKTSGYTPGIHCIGMITDEVRCSDPKEKVNVHCDDNEMKRVTLMDVYEWEGWPRQPQQSYFMKFEILKTSKSQKSPIISFDVYKDFATNPRSVHLPNGIRCLEMMNWKVEHRNWWGGLIDE